MSSTLSIKEWSLEDRPREKLATHGRNVLSDAELLAIIIGSGTKDLSAVELSRLILAKVDGNLAALGSLTIKDLQKFKGIGEAKAISIVAALELGRRRKEIEINRKPKVSCSKDIYVAMLPKLENLPYEEFWAVYLNRANVIIDMRLISRGGITGTVADVKIILKNAVDLLASGLIVCHNHPSGNLQPSKADDEVTKKIKESCNLIDSSLLDHVIISDQGYYSYADEGRI